MAPTLVFKSEAIVHPDDVASYISIEELPISYNPTLMALLWESLATREVRLLQHSMERRFRLPEECTWVNYVRCHDDIGWTFADEDASELGINGFGHRQFLNAFYTGRFPGSFARGVPFNYNPITQDMRISGMAASLAGLEQAMEINNPLYIEHALRRLLLIHSVIISVSGIPLIYLGDEIAMMNDYLYTEDPAKQVDSRWTHRTKFDWEKSGEPTRQKHATGTDIHWIKTVNRYPANKSCVRQRAYPIFWYGKQACTRLCSRSENPRFWRILVNTVRQSNVQTFPQNLPIFGAMV